MLVLVRVIVYISEDESFLCGMLAVGKATWRETPDSVRYPVLPIWGLVLELIASPRNIQLSLNPGNWKELARKWAEVP
jgi:hypothetical protein